MSFLKWISLTLAILFVGACTVNNTLATKSEAYTPSKSVFKEGQFYNLEPMQSDSVYQFFGILARYITEPKIDSMPTQALPMAFLSAEQLLELTDNTVHVVKLGHSSVLLKVYGEFWLFDPVFSERASPFSFLGPKRFHDAPIEIEQLPKIDKVFISHNHYDHLDKQSVKKLAAKTTQFLVPLGVGNELTRWGVDTNKISEFDWWQEQETSNGFAAFTPTKHFSGRAFSDNNKSLWGAWVIQSKQLRLFFGGDSGYFAGFKEIGNKYGPFDMTFIETGAYDKDWPDVHMTPEQSVQAHLDLNGKVMVPIHNGTFDLAFHAWYEPLERVSAIAKHKQVNLHTPITGQVTSLDGEVYSTLWWRSFMTRKETQVAIVD